MKWSFSFHDRTGCLEALVQSDPFGESVIKTRLLCVSLHVIHVISSKKRLVPFSRLFQP